MEFKNKDKGEIIIPIIMIILSIYLYTQTYSFKYTDYQQANPQMWPRGVLVLLILISTILIGKVLLKGIDWKPKPSINYKKSISIIIFLFLYIFLMQFCGYLISTLIFIFCALILFGNRNILQLIIVPLLIVTLIFLIFNYLLYIPLPKGIGFFRSITLFFQ